MKNSLKHDCYLCGNDCSKEVHLEIDYYCICLDCYLGKDDEKA